MTLIKQIESNAKKAGENRLAFLYRRKATMLQFCLDKVLFFTDNFPDESLHRTNATSIRALKRRLPCLTNPSPSSPF